MQPLKIFIGYDHRQPIAFTVLAHSIYAKSSKPVTICPLVLPQLPLKRYGLTPFTFSRFLVPYLCGFKGWALFLDADIILNEDISKLFDLADDRYSVMVSKNQKRFEWASVMLFNCSKNQVLTPDFVETAQSLHTISWVPEEEIGDLPPEWNHLVGYDEPRHKPKLVHYTQGIPAFPETDTCEHADLWREAFHRCNSATSWEELMGPSVHSTILRFEDGKEMRVPKYYLHPSGESLNDGYREKVRQLREAKYGVS